MPTWINGTEIAQQIQAEAAAEAQRLVLAGIRPGLAVVLVGDDPASHVYVRSKVRTCEALGMHSEKVEMPAASSTEDVLAAVCGLNARPDIHGILVQVPLPRQIDARTVLDAILPEKDVDGFHPVNVGKLVAGKAILKPCTPAGIMEVFRRLNIPLRGSRAVVIGRSDIVGKPMALLMMHADATVTICHSKTSDLPGVAREADILVAAIGKAALVDETFVKPGAVVIDVGTNRVDSAGKIREVYGEDAKRLADLEKKGYTLMGDVNAPRVFPHCSYLTPVPGGVGPLTIAMLMSNTVKAAASRAQAERTCHGSHEFHGSFLAGAANMTDKAKR
jgi:methylenetetrahydrofolate dehydrogenase (NADP+)/methenyltetrahydrofolate cyclohydrolase